MSVNCGGIIYIIYMTGGWAAFQAGSLVPLYLGTCNCVAMAWEGAGS